MGGAVGGIFANYSTGYIVQRFSYRPVFTVAGLMHPLAFGLLALLLLRYWKGERESAGGRD
jgi:MFS family permease